MFIYSYIKRENGITGKTTLALTPRSKENVFEFLAARQLDLSATAFKVNKAGEYTLLHGCGVSPVYEAFTGELATAFYREFGTFHQHDTKRAALAAERAAYEHYERNM